MDLSGFVVFGPTNSSLRQEVEIDADCPAASSDRSFGRKLRTSAMPPPSGTVRQSLSFIGHAVELIPQAEVERQRRAHFPVVFEEH